MLTLELILVNEPTETYQQTPKLFLGLILGEKHEKIPAGITCESTEELLDDCS